MPKSKHVAGGKKADGKKADKKWQKTEKVH